MTMSAECSDPLARFLANAELRAAAMRGMNAIHLTE
ncbi:hypothetical protein PTE30175_04263 [Pandoraea terrae]|uniref:Uncharacterized protein n=1 Tax=Pandoraea terrae TaxID=1537710 RepID=A0A5E4YA33_9BURK|nr:hypothetical protein PTE30175_04263 [Pandoraea terrae]